VDRQKYFIQVLLITGQRTPTQQLIGVRLAKLAAPFADDLVRHNHPTDEPQLRYTPLAEAEPVLQPDAVADDLRREAVVLVVGDG
jgi:hypothetical protein